MRFWSKEEVQRKVPDSEVLKLLLEELGYEINREWVDCGGDGYWSYTLKKVILK